MVTWSRLSLTSAVNLHMNNFCFYWGEHNSFHMTKQVANKQSFHWAPCFINTTNVGQGLTRRKTTVYLFAHTKENVTVSPQRDKVSTVRCSSFGCKSYQKVLWTLWNILLNLSPRAESQGSVLFWLLNHGGYPGVKFSSSSHLSPSMLSLKTPLVQSWTAYAYIVSRLSVTHLSAGQYVPCQFDLRKVSLADGFE